MTLKVYKAKRDFKKTPEPLGSEKKSQKLLFVIQKHAASHLHYDLRLEMKGVLKSWAIPKEPSLDPKVKRLAIEVEDHPLSYGSFEGTIPKGEYGAGTVEIWDKGHWSMEGNAIASLKKGDITFTLVGKRLKGAWKLIRIKSKENEKKNQWLFFKLSDSGAQKKRNAC